MIAKISKGSSPRGVFEYNQKKVEAGEASVLNSRGFYHDEHYNHSVQDCMRSIEPWMINNNRTEKPMVHISLNPDPRDVIDDEQAVQIAEEYLEKMGYGEQPYILYKHEDIDRVHYHIATLCIDEYGKKLNDRYDKRRSMKASREIELKYKLHTPSKFQIKESERPQKIDYEKGDLKANITNNLQLIVSTYRISSFTDYQALLALNNIDCSEINGIIEGEQIQGLIYSATDDEGVKVGRQLKSSLFGKEFGRKALDKMFAKNKKMKVSDRDKAFLKKVIVQCLYQNKTRSREELVELLHKRGIDLILRDTKDGSRLFGVTVIDHNTKQVLKGSDIAPEFSATQLKNYFDNPHFIIPFPLENKGIENAPLKENEMSFDGNDSNPFAGLVANPTAGDAQAAAYERMKKKRKWMNRN